MPASSPSRTARADEGDAVHRAADEGLLLGGIADLAPEPDRPTELARIWLDDLAEELGTGDRDEAARVLAAVRRVLHRHPAARALLEP